MYQGKFNKKRTPSAPVEQESPVLAPEDAQPESGTKAPRRPRTNTLIFYTSYVTLILLFIIGMFFTVNSLEQKLIDFEAAQPGPKSEAVFAELFAEPDWAALYDLAGIEDTTFEGREAFASYMEQRVNGQPLSYRATSAGLSGGKKYIVTLGSEIIGSFTLVSDPESDVAQWELGGIDLIREHARGIRIRKLSGHTAYVNGVALDDSYTTHIGSTTADDYLPRGVYNVWIHTQQLDGLMAEPTVTAVNELGESVDVIYDSKNKTYITADPTNTCTAQEKELALNTVKAYALFLLNRIPQRDLKIYFNSESPLYQRILDEEVWIRTNFNPKFDNETIVSFYRYSDDIYSIRVSLTAYVTRVNGTQKELHLEKTLIFQQSETGWTCADMIDQDLSRLDQSVRITFMDGDTLLSSEFYDTDLQQITTPLLCNSEGHAVTGWYREEIDGNGLVRRIPVLTPDSYGNATVPEDVHLEPMTLYALYNDIPTEK